MVLMRPRSALVSFSRFSRSHLYSGSAMRLGAGVSWNVNLAKEECLPDV